MHACIGLPLMANQRLIGALTIDSFDPHQFGVFSDDELRTVMALAAASLNNAILIEQLEKRAGNIQLEAAILSNSNGMPEAIGQPDKMLALQGQIEALANNDLSVLVMGETGVGKELVASALHTQSSRANEALIYLNCAALPESVAESELFGHIKGSFTGAISNRSEQFEMTDKGTLFLDEIGELPLPLQAKLLRVLQYGDLQRVGDDRILKVDARIIAATNKDLNKEVIAGRFRADLYHRLSVFPIMVPPLRERGDDIVLLAGFFIERCRTKLGLRHLSLGSSCQALLKAYTWPGNIRELEHSIHRAAILARAESQDENVTIKPQHFDSAIFNKEFELATDGVSVQSAGQRLTSQVGNLRESTDQFQYQLIKQALDNSNNNWAATARQLSVDMGNLHRLAMRLGLK
ncbi:MAG: nitric oxide reductase transcriptional regulator NorR [Amphritea sp.]